MAQGQAVQKVDNAIHQMNHRQADSMVCFVNTYPLDRNLSGRQCYPAFEQPRPDVEKNIFWVLEKKMAT